MARGLAVLVIVVAGEGEAVGLRVAVVSGGGAGALGAAWAMSSPAAPRMVGTMTTASGQSSLFMITRSVAVPWAGCARRLKGVVPKAAALRAWAARWEAAASAST